MRFLCLHGSGASATIMEAQTAPIRDLLLPSYEFDFLEAPHASKPAPELKGIYPGPYFAFFERYSASAMAAAIEYVRDVVEKDGPYDAVMGFSQGASVAAAYIADEAARRGSFGPPSAYSDSSSDSLGGDVEPFKFAVFMCAGLIDPKIATGPELVRTIGSLGAVDIPTLHVVGKKDPIAPQSLQLVKSCQQDVAQVVFHSGGHDLPRDAASCRDIAAGFERTLLQALSG